MFGSIGPQEILIVLVIALIVLGPRSCPRWRARSARASRSSRRASTTTTSSTCIADEEDDDEPVSSRVPRAPARRAAARRAVAARARRPGCPPPRPRLRPTRPLRTLQHRTVIGLLTRLARVRRLDHGEEVSLVEHLTELRERLIAAFIVARRRVRGRVLAQPGHLQAPQPASCRTSSRTSKPITTEIGEPFTTHDHLGLHGAAAHVPVHVLPAVRVRDPGVLGRDDQEGLADPADRPAAVHRGRGVRLLRRRPLGGALPLLLGLERGQRAAARSSFYSFELHDLRRWA